MTTDFLPERLMERARGDTGLSNFGADDFREPLAVLCASLDGEAPLSAAGRDANAQRLVAALSRRLTWQAWFDRYPEIAQERIAAPVVIVGLPRTGTTMLYRMLSSASAFAAPLFYEVIGAPPPLDWDFRRESDPRIPAARTIVAAMMAAMPDLASIYPFEAEAPEESIFLYAPSFRSTSEHSNALVPGFADWFRDADKRPAYAYLKRMLQLLQWLRRKAGGFGEGQRWLLKTPDHIHGLDALFAVFPDARIIQTHRDPLQTIPSICSFIRVLQRPAASRDTATEIGRAWSDLFAGGMTRALAVRARHEEAFLDIRYEDTVARADEVATQVFAFLGEALDETGRAEMERWREANRRDGRPAHRYSLAEFGLSESGIETDFAAYRERFIVTRGSADGAA